MKHLVIINTSIPSKFLGRNPRIETKTVTVEYNGLYPEANSLIVKNLSGEPENLDKLDKSEIVVMIWNGTKSKVVTTCYDSMTATTAYNFMD